MITSWPFSLRSNVAPVLISLTSDKDLYPRTTFSGFLEQRDRDGVCLFMLHRDPLTIEVLPGTVRPLRDKKQNKTNK